MNPEQEKHDRQEATSSYWDFDRLAVAGKLETKWGSARQGAPSSHKTADLTFGCLVCLVGYVPVCFARHRSTQQSRIAQKEMAAQSPYC